MVGVLERMRGFEPSAPASRRVRVVQSDGALWTSKTRSWAIDCGKFLEYTTYSSIAELLLPTWLNIPMMASKVSVEVGSRRTLTRL